MVVLDHFREEESKSTHVDLQREIDNEMVVKFTLRCGTPGIIFVQWKLGDNNYSPYQN